MTLRTESFRRPGRRRKVDGPAVVKLPGERFLFLAHWDGLFRDSRHEDATDNIGTHLLEESFDAENSLQNEITLASPDVLVSPADNNMKRSKSKSKSTMW